MAHVLVSAIGFHPAVEPVGEKRLEIAVATLAHALDETEVLAAALQTVNTAGLEEVASLGLLHDDHRLVKTLGKVRKPGTAPIKASVVVGEKQVGVGLVANDPIIEPALDDALGRAVKTPEARSTFPAFPNRRSSRTTGVGTGKPSTTLCGRK